MHFVSFPVFGLSMVLVVFDHYLLRTSNTLKQKKWGLRIYLIFLENSMDILTRGLTIDASDGV